MLSTQSLVETRARELDVLNQAVIATDATGQVLYWNDAARRLYGWESAEAIGRQIVDLTPSLQSRDDAVRIMAALARGKHWSGEFPVTRKDGSTFVAHVIDAPVHDELGQLVGIIGISSDLTPIMRLQTLARDLSGASTPVAVAKVALDAAMEVSGAAAGWVMTLNTERTCLERLYSHGYPDDVVQRFNIVPLDAPFPITMAVNTGEPVFVTSLDEWRERFPATADVTDKSTRGWIALPLRIGDRIAGAMGLSVRIEREFTDQDRNLLIALSQHAAVAVDRARLFEMEQTARREAEAARAKAEEANRVKSSFLANMSHELRTPLGAIIGYHDLIADEILGPLNDVQQQHLKRLRNSATHLLSVIDEILSFSRLEAAREVVHTERGRLGSLLDGVIEIVGPLASAKQLELSVDCAEPNLVIDSDIQKLRQILVNLAGNAVKYTERGSVRLLCAASRDRLRIAVSDTGVGIAPDHLEFVFDPFWQVQEARSRKSGGTGLGLSVSRSLARLLGGEITVASEVGKGSTFALEVPLKPVQP